MIIAGFEGCPIDGETIERDVLYGVHAFKKAKRFALTVLLLKENIEPETISRVVGVSKRQIYNYRKAYQTEGIPAIVSDARYRPASELEPHKEVIKEDLKNHPAATASEASERIFTLTGIQRSPTQV